MEKTGPVEFDPIPVLSEINQQPPTAELRPPVEAQTDETDLIPYDLLDVVERAAVRDKFMPLEVYQLLKIEFPQYNRHQLEHWVIRFFQLWSRNQWKRYAPSFHLDDENLDPKTWCRFPILSVGSARVRATPGMDSVARFVSRDCQKVINAIAAWEASNFMSDLTQVEHLLHHAICRSGNQRRQKQWRRTTHVNIVHGSFMFVPTCEATDVASDIPRRPCKDSPAAPRSGLQNISGSTLLTAQT